MSDLLILEKKGHIALLTFNNPPAHTWTPQSRHECRSYQAVPKPR